MFDSCSTQYSTDVDHADGAGGMERDHAHDQVLELATLPGQLVGGQRTHRLVGDTGACGPWRGMRPARSSDETRDIGATVAQRVGYAGGRRSAGTKVIAEARRLTSARGPCCRRDHPHIDRSRLGAADSSRFLVPAARAKKLHLRGGLELADLVEKQRAALGELELAEALPVGAGEGALLVAESVTR